VPGDAYSGALFLTASSFLRNSHRAFIANAHPCATRCTYIRIGKGAPTGIWQYVGAPRRRDISVALFVLVQTIIPGCCKFLPGLETLIYVLVQIVVAIKEQLETFC
jgi:hypothetical protein